MDINRMQQYKYVRSLVLSLKVESLSIVESYQNKLDLLKVKYTGKQSYLECRLSVDFFKINKAGIKLKSFQKKGS